MHFFGHNLSLGLVHVRPNLLQVYQKDSIDRSNPTMSFGLGANVMSVPFGCFLLSILATMCA